MAYFRKVINEIDAIEFDEYDERHAFGEIYETILKVCKALAMRGSFIPQEPLLTLW